MVEYWDNIPLIAIPSLVLGGTLAWYNERDVDKAVRWRRRFTLLYVTAAPTIMVAIGVANIAHDPRMSRIANKLPSTINFILSIIEGLALLTVVASIKNNTLSTGHLVIGIFITVLFVPVTLLSFLIWAQLLSGVSL